MEGSGIKNYQCEIGNGYKRGFGNFAKKSRDYKKDALFFS